MGDDEVPDWNLLKKVQNAKLRKQQSSGTGGTANADHNNNKLSGAGGSARADEQSNKTRESKEGKLIVVYFVVLSHYFFISI